MRTVALAATLLLSTGASAAVYVETTYTDPRESKGAPETGRMWFDGSRFRAELHGEDMVHIYKDQTLYVIERKTKTYTAIDKPTLEKVGGQLTAMRRQMEQQLAGLPPEQRQMVEKMLGQSAGGDAPAKRSVRKTARTGEAAGHACVIWEVTAEGRKEQELCVAPAGSLPQDEELMSTMSELGAMFATLAESLGASGGDAMSEAWSELQTIKGIPLVTRSYRDGALAFETRITAIRNETLPAGAFDLPAGYRKRSLEVPQGG